MELAGQLRLLRPGALVLLSSLLAACLAPGPGEEEKGGEPGSLKPISSPSSVLVEPQTGRECLDVFKPRLFEGLTPGMTGEAASAVLGPPARRSVDRKDQKFFEWDRSAGRVLVSHEEDRSFGSAWTWKLRGYPSGGASVEQALPPDIVSRIDRRLDFVEVAVLYPDRRPCLIVIVKKGRVDRVQFVNPP